MTFEEDMKAFLERMGYHNIEHDVETNEFTMDFWPPPPSTKEYSQRSFDGWQAPPEVRRFIRYRQTSNGTWQEVYEEPSGHIFYGMYMPDGFVPPKEQT